MVVASFAVVGALMGSPAALAHATDLEALGPDEPEAPLWSFCATYSPPANRGESTPEERHRTTIKIRTPKRQAPKILETRAELPPDQDPSLGHCVPWGPGITGASAGSQMSASGRDEDEIPICVEGAQCGPVSPKRPTSTVWFSAAKAVMPCFPWTGWLLVPGDLSSLSLGKGHAGYARALFRPPRSPARA